MSINVSSIQKAGKRARSLVLALVSVVPLAVAAILALLVYPRGSEAAFYMWPSTTLVTEALGLALAITVVLILLLAYRRAPRLLVIGVTVGIIVRAFVALLLLPGLSPFSDFEQVWQIATQVASEQTTLYKSFFPEWCDYIAVVRLLVDGVGLTYGGLVLASVVLGCIVVGEVYLLARIATRRHEAGLLAAALYALMPSQVIYALIPTPDMLSMAVLVGAACLLAWQLRSDFDVVHSLGLTLLAGVLIGVGSSFKPIGLVLAIAYAMALGVKLLVLAPGGWARALVAALPAVVVLVLAAGVPQLMRGASEGILGFGFSRSATASYLCIGLNTEGEGQIHLGTKSRYYNTLRLSGVNEDEAASETYEMLREDWAKNASDLPRLFLKKVVWAWQDDMAPVHLLTDYSIDEGRLSGVGVAVLESIEAMGAPLSQGYYLAIMALAAMGAIVSVKKHEEGNLSFALVFLALLLLGFFCLLLLSEAQSRYKSNVLPYVVVFSALGLPAVANAWMDRRRLAMALRERVAAAKSSQIAQFLSKKMSVSWGWIAILVLVYTFIPVAIFFVGWTRWCVALVCLAAFAFAGRRFLRSDEFRAGGGAPPSASGSSRVLRQSLFLWVGSVSGLATLRSQETG